MQNLNKKSQHNNRNSSYYFSLSHKLLPNPPSSSFNHHAQAFQKQQHFTFNKSFYPTTYNKSATPYHNINLSKYRSASLPSQCLVRNPSRNHFSYYDQLKNRDYIVGKNYRVISQLKSDLRSLNRNSYDNLQKSNLHLHEQRNQLYPTSSVASIHNTQLNRFSKYDPQNAKKLSKSTFSNKAPLIKTNIRLYDKPDHQNRHTQINSNFQPHQYTLHNGALISQQKQKINDRSKEVPLVDCNIEVKSDDEGRYYSTVESQFPAVVNGHRAWHDPEENVLTTEAFLVRDYSNPFEKVQFSQKSHNMGSVYTSKIQIPASQMTKDIQTSSTNKVKYYDTYIVKLKNSPLKSQEKHLYNSSQTQTYLQSMEQKPHQRILSQPIQQSPQKIKRKIIIQYQVNSPKKNTKSPTKPEHKKKSTTKTHAQNLGLKYYYSKYYIAQQENRHRNRSKSSSIKKSQKSQNKQKAKILSSKHKTHQKSSKKINSARSPKTKQKAQKPSPANYTSTHLLTVKK